MAVIGILSSQAAFSQAEFQQLKQQATNGTAQHQAQWQDFGLGFRGVVPAPKTDAGSGGTAVWMNTPATQDNVTRQIESEGYNATRLAPAQFQPTYTGHLLDPSWHLMPGFGAGHVDFHA
jgi:hypothetical protein